MSFHRVCFVYHNPKPSGWSMTSYDFMQLGYLLAYVFDENIWSTDYHIMSFDSFSDDVKNDYFISKLLKSVYDPNLLESSIVKSGQLSVDNLLNY